MGLLQLSCIAAFAVAFFCVLVLLRHETDDYFTPLPDYIRSIKIAVPPALVFIATYVIGILTGIAISDVPKAVIGYFRNVYFQSSKLMACSIAVIAAFALATSWIETKMTPPAYEQLVSAILKGESDDHQIAQDKIKEIQKVNPALGAKLALVLGVFTERAAINAGKKEPSSQRAQILVRSLLADGSQDWVNHPLRKHALAEAYVLFGQSMEQAGAIEAPPKGPQESNPYVSARNLYEDVASSNETLAPDMLKTSARINIGNTYYYAKDYDRAEDAYRKVMSTEAGRDNLSPWGNLIAALILAGRPQEAIDEGLKAREAAEKTGRAITQTFAFASVMENTGFARLKLGDTKGALGDFATAHAFRDDDLTKQNLALILILSGRSEDAQKLLRKMAPSALPDVPLDLDAKDAAPRCVYLLWALATPADRPALRGANLRVFLDEKPMPHESQINADEVAKLLLRAKEDLPKVGQPCSDLSQFQRVVALFGAQQPPVALGP